MPFIGERTESTDFAIKSVAIVYSVLIRIEEITSRGVTDCLLEKSIISDLITI